MTQAMVNGEPLSEGQIIATTAGNATVRVQCIRVGAAYRLGVLNSSGFEIDGLCMSFPAEATARHAARVATTLLRAGWTVQQLLDLVAVFNTTAA